MDAQAPTALQQMKNLRFDQLEQLLPEDDWLAGESLLAAGALSSLRETERRFWIGRVVDGIHSYETEVHVTPSRIKVAACECERYRAQGCCGHLVATVLSLRARLADQAAVLQANRKVQTTPRAASKQNRLKDLLAQTDTAELHLFLLDYARRQPGFALALRTHLGSDAHTPHYGEQSRELLENTLQAARQPNGRIGLRGAQQVARIVEELLNYSRRQLGRNDWIEAASIAQLLIDRLPPVLRKVERGRETWIQLLGQAIQLIDDVLHQPLAPALRDKLMAWLRDTFNKLTVRNWELDIPLWEIWLRHALPTTEAVAEAGQQLIQYYLNEGKSPAPLFDRWHQQQGAAFRQWLLLESLQSMGWRWPALAWFVQQQHWAEAGQLAAYGGVQALPAPAPEVEDYLLPALQHAGEEKLLQYYLYQGLCQKLDKRYYDLLQAYQLAEPNSLLEALGALPFSGQKVNLTALILADYKRWDELLDLAARQPQSEVLLTYARVLLQVRPQRFCELAEQWLLNYLNGHIGRKSAQRVSEWLQLWQQAGANDLVARMLSYIRVNFPERHTLREELATLMI